MGVARPQLAVPSQMRPTPTPPSLSCAGAPQVINALLGEKFLADGVLPTTNEISILRWAGQGACAGWVGGGRACVRACRFCQSHALCCRSQLSWQATSTAH